ncbi:MAG TPA: hypothetical protein PKD85_07995, partial [Saprospiraceae bacterium]|nr:hypothetical protein [Saprospiraceae bacterium]
LPLMILPYLLFYYRKKYQLFTFLFTFSVVIFVCFLPLFLGLDLTNIFNSIDLYFRKFEFNASIYYLQRWLGFQLSGYNLIAYIGPLNGLISFAIIMYFSYILAKKKDDSFFQIGYIAFMIYLLLSPIIHPWYIMTPLLFSINLRHWHVIAWSYLAILSYAHYHEGRFTERYWLLFLEYGLLCTIYLLEKKFVVNT